MHVVTTDIVSGETVVLSSGRADDAIVATTAIPGVFAAVRYHDLFLFDGAISSNTPVRIAIMKGATRLITLPTGYACAGRGPPMGAVANAIHALTLLIARQLTEEIGSIPANISYRVVQPLCPLTGSPYDFSMTGNHIDRARCSGSTRADWSTEESRTRCARISTSISRASTVRIKLYDTRLNEWSQAPAA